MQPYTKGTEGNLKEELKGLLKYMGNSCDSNVTNESWKKIDRMMKKIKSDEELSLEYMKMHEREQITIYITISTELITRVTRFTYGRK